MGCDCRAASAGTFAPHPDPDPAIDMKGDTDENRILPLRPDPT